jgi:hypothetical protein
MGKAQKRFYLSGEPEMRIVWSSSYQRWNIFGNNLSALDSVKAATNSPTDKENALQQLFKYLQGIKPEIRFESISENEWTEISSDSTGEVNPAEESKLIESFPDPPIHFLLEDEH